MSTPPARSVSLPHAHVSLNADGVPYSTVFADIYHPAAGAPEQARHVFLAGNGLPARWRARRTFTIVETGFGLGLNFLEAWRACDDDPDAPRALHFLSVDNGPPSRDTLARLHARWPEHAARSRALLDAWPPPLAGFHRLILADGRVVLTLLLGDARELLPELDAHADAFFLDGFAPARNPQLWSPDLFAQLARLAAPGATLATWSVAAAVRDGLAAAGFAVEKRAGFAGKRDMLCGLWRAGANEAPPPAARRAIVIGTGLAGSTVAERLGARGWDVEVLEREHAPAQQASGNPLALASPLVNLADGANARLSRAAFLFALRYYAALGPGIMRDPPGVLRIARDARDADRFAQLLGQLDYPREFAACVDAGEGLRLAGRPVSRSGIWFPSGLLLAPGTACASALERWPRAVRRRFGVHAARLEAYSGGWRVRDAGGAILADAPVAILAAGAQLGAFAQAAHLPLESNRGQVTLLPADPSRQLRIAVSGDRHAVMLPDGRCMIGASFQPGDADPSVRAADHAENIAGVEAMLPGLCAGIAPDSPALAGRTGFRVATPDRLPVHGTLLPGLLVAGGLGARGLVWAPLGAELLAAHLEAEPCPLPRELALAASPVRFNRPAR